MTEGHTRRHFLGLAAAAAVSGTMAAPAIAAPTIIDPRGGDRRALAFQNLHTGESLDVVYWAEGSYLPEAESRINHLLRDFRTDTEHRIHPKLLDLLAALKQHLRSEQPHLVISGYRSPATNAMLHATTEGVAKSSFHMSGRAIDIRVPDRPLATLHRTALEMRAGGVGYYPHSDFVHLDIGPVRRW